MPRDRLDRANGLAQLGGGVAQIASPAMAGVFLPLIGVGGIFVIDLVSFVYAVVVLVWLPGQRTVTSAARDRVAVVPRSGDGSGTR